MKIVHNFSKIFFKTAELINLISVSRASFYRMQNKWIARGIDPKQFGKVTVQGVPLWNGPIFLKFLNEYEINNNRWDYEQQDQQIALQILDQHYEK
jgi:hypothetical protein